MKKHIIKNECSDIILHDCIITNMQLKNNVLEMSFENGFWLMPNYEENPTTETIRTGPSKVQFVDIDLEWVRIYLYKSHRLLRKTICTTVNEVSLEKMMRWINKGKRRFEIITELYGSNMGSFDGEIFGNKNKDWREARMLFWFKKAVFLWEDICPDCIF